MPTTHDAINRFKQTRLHWGFTFKDTAGRILTVTSTDYQQRNFTALDTDKDVEYEFTNFDYMKLSPQ
jgi:hypothetical protein